MPKYTVAITEVIEYLVPIEAANEEQAQEMGERTITDSIDRNKYFVSCRARECEGVNTVTSAEHAAAVDQVELNALEIEQARS